MAILDIQLTKLIIKFFDSSDIRHLFCSKSACGHICAEIKMALTITAAAASANMSNGHAQRKNLGYRIDHPTDRE